MKQQNKINWSYISGLLESDGSITCFLEKKQLKYIVKISSTKNTNSLNDVILFLEEQGIKAGFTDQRAAQRGTSIRIQGNNQVVTFLTELTQQVSCLEGSTYKCPLLGVKLRNLLLILAVPNQAQLTDAQKIDFKKTFQKENYEQSDLELSSTITRDGYEQRFNLVLNASRDSFKQSIKKIDATYSEHVAKVKAFKGQLNAGYVVGLFDGDGGFNVGFSKSPRDRRVDVTCEVNLTLAIADSFILDPIVEHFNIETPTFEKSAGAVQMKIRKQDSVQTVLDFFDVYPLLGDYKYEGFVLLKDTLAKKKAGYFNKDRITATEFKQFMKSKFAYSNLRGMTYDGLYEFVDANYQ
jgi:hypothetical protein